MKLAVVSHTFNTPNGRKVLKLFQVLSARYKDEVHVITVNKWKNYNDQELETFETKHLKIHRLLTFYKGYQHRYFVPGLIRKLVTLKPDIVYAAEEPLCNTTFFSLVAARMLKVPFVFFSWENIYTKWPFPISAMEEYVIRHADWCIAGTPDVSRVLLRKGMDKKRFTVMPSCGCDTKLYRPFKSKLDKRHRIEKDKTILYVGRFIPEKGIDNIIKAREILRRKGRTYQFLFVGATKLGVEFDFLKNQKDVRVVGWTSQEELPSYYNAAAVFLYPSRPVLGLVKKWEEQFGHSIVEALCCEVPVIASGVSGPRHIIRNGLDGYLVKVDDYAELANKIETLMEDEKLRHTFGVFGRRDMVNRFSNEVIANRLHSCLTNLTKLKKNKK